MAQNNDPIEILRNFESDVERLLNSNNHDKYDESYNKLRLYFSKFGQTAELKKQIDFIKDSPKDDYQLRDGYNKILALISALIEEININEKLFFITNSEYNSLIIKSEALEASERVNTQLQDKIQVADKQRGDFLLRLADLEANLHLKEAEITKAESIIERNSAEITAIRKSHSEYSTAAELLKNKYEADLLKTKAELSIYKEAAQKTEIARNSTNFHEQAEKNRKTAEKWGGFAVLSILLFLLVIYFIFSQSGELFKIATDISKEAKGMESSLIHQLILIEISKRIGSKILMISLITYFITFLVKNYNAQMHNYVINSHKANALRSTVDLIGTAKQDDGNDKIIIQATQAIFTPQKSGYQGTESEPASPNLITNVVDAVSKKN